MIPSASTMFSGPLTEVKENEDMEGDDDEYDELKEDDEDEAMDEEDEDEMEASETPAGGGDALGSAVRIAPAPAEAKAAEPEVKRPRWENPPQAFDPETMSLSKFTKKAMKKNRKEANRNVRRAHDLSNMMAAFGGIDANKNEGEDYDFKDYF